MNKADYTTSILVDTTPQEVFKAINSVPDWWTRNFEGQSEKPGDVFTVRFGETFITLKTIEFAPDKKIGWHVIDCNKHWLKNQKEWKDTQISWEISSENNVTKLSLTHTGLVPGLECYEICEQGWNFYIHESLFKLLTEGQGVSEL